MNSINRCDIYWGSHGCHKRKHHKTKHHACDPCKWWIFHWLGKLLKIHPYCVERWPYYGKETKFYGDDVNYYKLPNS